MAQRPWFPVASRIVLAYCTKSSPGGFTSWPRGEINSWGTFPIHQNQRRSNEQDLWTIFIMVRVEEIHWGTLHYHNNLCSAFEQHRSGCTAATMKVKIVPITQNAGKEIMRHFKEESFEEELNISMFLVFQEWNMSLAWIKRSFGSSAPELKHLNTHVACKRRQAHIREHDVYSLNSSQLITFSSLGTANCSLLESLPRRTYTPGEGAGRSSTYWMYFGTDG